MLQFVQATYLLLIAKEMFEQTDWVCILVKSIVHNFHFEDMQHIEGDWCIGLHISHKVAVCDISYWLVNAIQ